MSHKLIAGILEHWFVDTNETEVWSGKSRTTTWNIDGNVYTYHDGEESAGGQESSGVHPGRRPQNDAKLIFN